MTAARSDQLTRPALVPVLPSGRGPISSAVFSALRTGIAQHVPASEDAYDEDTQLALYCLYELHYRGFADVDPALEWDPPLLAVRQDLERAFLARLRADVAGGDDVDAEMRALLREPTDADGNGVSFHLLLAGESWQLLEYLAHRSIYHLKEADPQAWAIPRMHGPAKVGLVTVEYDEYGSGDPARIHSELFAGMLRAVGLDARYHAYLDVVPAETLAEVNLMSLFGLHRRLRGALVGQFATVELTSSPSAARMVAAMQSIGLPPAATEFYAEHVEADSVHEMLIRRGVIWPMLDAEPELAADVVFGMQASVLLAGRFDRELLDTWSRRRTSLRRPLHVNWSGRGQGAAPTSAR